MPEKVPHENADERHAYEHGQRNAGQNHIELGKDLMQPLTFLFLFFIHCSIHHLSRNHYDAMAALTVSYRPSDQSLKSGSE